MVFKRNLVFFIFMALAAVGCGKFDAAGSGNLSANGTTAHAVKPYGTCDRSAVATINLCSEAVGTDYNEQGYLDILQSSCESTGGLFSTENCERLGSVGTCVIESGRTNETHVTYYPPEYTAASAQTACESTPAGVYTSN